MLDALLLKIRIRRFVWVLSYSIIFIGSIVSCNIDFSDIDGVKDILPETRLDAGQGEFLAPKQPKFNVIVQVFDGQDGRGVGNSNSTIDYGEQVLCLIMVGNYGNAVSGATTVKIKEKYFDVGGLKFQGQLEHTLGEIAVGKQASCSFDILVGPEYRNDYLNFSVNVLDPKYHINTVKTVSLRVNRKINTDVVVIRKKLEVIVDKAPLHAGPSNDTDILGYINKGDIVISESRSKDYYRIVVDNNFTCWINKKNVEETQTNLTGEVSAPTLIRLMDNTPLLVVSSPDNGYVTDSGTLIIRGVAKDDNALKTLRISINGNEVLNNDLHGTRIAFEEKVKINPGTNTITVSVHDSAEQTDTLTFDVTYVSKFPILKGFYEHIWVVVIGIDVFEDHMVPTLNYAVKDAKAIERLFREELVYTRILTLYNEDATRDNILNILQGELLDAGTEDAVIVYIATHGASFKGENRDVGYLIPYDGSYDQKKRYKNISMQTFKKDIAEVINAKHMLLIVDSCYGGLLTRGVGIRNENVRSQDEESFLRNIKDSKTKIIITAGDGDEEVLDGGLGGHSVFTGRIIEKIQNSDYFVSAVELFDYVRTRVLQDSHSRGFVQTPQFGYWVGDNDIILIKR